MANDIIITPASSSIQFNGSVSSDISLKTESNGSLNFTGASGSLFSIESTLSGSLMSVGDISGLPILEVFSDSSVNIGKFNSEAIKVLSGGQHVQIGYGGVLFVSSSNQVAIGKIVTPTNTLHVSASSNPVRFQGISAGADSSFLTIDANGVLHTNAGASGTSGTSGANGASGTSGTSGAAGGSAGTSGVGSGDAYELRFYNLT